MGGPRHCRNLGGISLQGKTVITSSSCQRQARGDRPVLALGAVGLSLEPR